MNSDLSGVIAMSETDGMIDEERLLSLFGCQRRGVLRRLLKANNVRFLVGSEGRLITTREAMNAAMGILAPSWDTLLNALEDAQRRGTRRRIGDDDPIPDGEITISTETPLRPRGRPRNT